MAVTLPLAVFRWRTGPLPFPLIFLTMSHVDLMDEREFSLETYDLQEFLLLVLIVRRAFALKHWNLRMFSDVGREEATLSACFRFSASLHSSLNHGLFGRLRLLEALGIVFSAMPCNIDVYRAMGSSTSLNRPTVNWSAHIDWKVSQSALFNFHLWTLSLVRGPVPP